MPGVEPRRGRRESVKVKATVVPTTSNRHTKPRMVDRLNHVLVRYRSHANVYASPPTQCFPREYIFWDRFTTTSWSLRLQPHFDASAGGPIFLLFFINCYRHNFLLIGQECIARLDTGRLASSLSISWVFFSFQNNTPGWNFGIMHRNHQGKTGVFGVSPPQRGRQTQSYQLRLHFSILGR
jgi:hypothetical protein